MDDSAYISQSDAASRGNGQHDNLMNQFLCSPSLSSVSQSGYQAHQPLPQFSLGESAIDSTTYGPFQPSDAGAYGSPTTFSPTNLDLSGNNMHRAFDANWPAQAFNGSYGMSPMNPGQFYQPAMDAQFTNFYNEKPMTSAQIDTHSSAIKRPVPHMQLDTSAALNPRNLTSPSPLSRTRPSGLQRTTSGKGSQFSQNATRYVHCLASRSGFCRLPTGCSLKSPSVKSISDLKEDDLDDQSTASRSASARLPEDVESKMARTHPLYQATPGDDDMYHCPQEGKSGCNHKPTKLKCNYE